MVKQTLAPARAERLGALRRRPTAGAGGSAE